VQLSRMRFRVRMLSFLSVASEMVIVEDWEGDADVVEKACVLRSDVVDK
jgi:nitrate/nitrite-specific signal transduction histidine kinase